MARVATCTPESPKPRSRFDIGDIFRAHGAEYRRSYPLGPEQAKAMRALTLCRTAALGGHLDVCDSCGHERPAYNSCRNRHCPKCQSLAQAKWLETRKERILPTRYFHVVFTMPQELRALAMRNPRELYGLLFQSSAATLKTLAADDKWLGAQLGFTSVLHTWTRKLGFHPHVHCVVTGGGLDPEGKRWVACRRDFLFPVNVMSQLFRGKFLDGLQRLYQQGRLDRTGCDQLSSDATFHQFKSELYGKKWVVYVKAPFGGAKHVYTYLSRYTHRVAISNSRLIEVTDDNVCFATKHGDKTTLTPLEFIRRFLRHVLPKGFVKIRHYGLLSSANATTKLEVARALLEERDVEPKRDEDSSEHSELPERGWRQRYKELTGLDLSQCPSCLHGTMVRHSLLSSLGRDLEFWNTS
jgi:hypothetical protein